MAAPFEQAFDEYQALHDEASKYTSESAPQGVLEGGQVRAIHYREEEAIYVKASHDRVTVIFSTIFREETDRIFGKVFLQEFVDARRRAIQNAPQVLFRHDPPLELQGMSGLPPSGTADVGYVTFVLFPRHLQPARRYEVISHIQTFRDYFHYHIKASKAYIHSRMRRRTADFLQGETSVRTTSVAKLMFKQSFVAQDQRPRKRSARQPVAGPSGSRRRYIPAPDIKTAETMHFNDSIVPICITLEAHGAVCVSSDYCCCCSCIICIVLCLKSSLAVGMTLLTSYLIIDDRSMLPIRDEIILIAGLRVSCVSWNK
jgi:hypothetical protein